MSTRATDSGNTSDGASSSPGLSGVLVSLLPEDSVSLSSVLGHVRVAESYDIISDGCVENVGHSVLTGGGVVFVPNGYGGTGRHYSSGKYK